MLGFDFYNVADQQITDQDKQQLRDLFKSQEFLHSSGEAREAAINKLSLVGKVPFKKDKFVNFLVNQAQAIPIPAGPPTPPVSAKQDKDSPSGFWDRMTTPISQQLGMKTIREWNKASEERNWRSSFGKGWHQTPEGALQKTAVAVDTAMDEGAGLLDATQTPLGLLTLGVGPKIRALKMAGEPLLAKIGVGTLKTIEGAVRTGYVSKQIAGALDSLYKSFENPTIENITRFVSQATIAGVVSKPEGEKAIRSIKAAPEALRSAYAKVQRTPEAIKAGIQGARTGPEDYRQGKVTVTGKQKGDTAKSAPEAEAPQAVPRIVEQGAKTHGVTHETYQEAHKLDTHELQTKGFEAQHKVDEMRSAEAYNARATKALEDLGGKLGGLRKAAEDAELSGKDPAKAEAQAKELEDRINGIRSKVSANTKKINEYKDQNVEGHAKMYDSILRERNAPPTPKPKASEAKKEPAAEQKPKQADPAIAKILQSTANAEPTSSEVAKRKTAAPPQSVVTGHEFINEPPKQVAAPGQKALPASEQKALPAPEATAAPPAAGPIAPPLKPPMSAPETAAPPVQSAPVQQVAAPAAPAESAPVSAPAEPPVAKKTVAPPLSPTTPKPPAGKSATAPVAASKVDVGPEGETVESLQEKLDPEKYNGKKMDLAKRIYGGEPVADEEFSFLNETDRELLGRLQDEQAAKAKSKTKPKKTAAPPSGKLKAPLKQTETETPKAETPAAKAETKKSESETDKEEVETKAAATKIREGTAKKDWDTLGNMKILRDLSDEGGYSWEAARAALRKVSAGEKIKLSDLAKHMPESPSGKTPEEYAYNQLLAMEKQGLIKEEDWDIADALADRGVKTP